MATKKNYSVNNDKRTVTGDIAKMTEREMGEIQMLCGLGYIFNQKNTRNGSSRKRSHYKGQLVEIDREIFEELASRKGKGSYSQAASFASHIIKLGKYADQHPDGTEGVLNEFRNLAQKDMVEAKFYAEGILAQA